MVDHKALVVIIQLIQTVANVIAVSLLGNLGYVPKGLFVETIYFSFIDTTALQLVTTACFLTTLVMLLSLSFCGHSDEVLLKTFFFRAYHALFAPLLFLCAVSVIGMRYNSVGPILGRIISAAAASITSSVTCGLLFFIGHRASA